jgi:hypothetical protein
MKTEVDRLLSELSDMRGHQAAVGPDHPRFKKWLVDVKAHLSQHGGGVALKCIEQIGFLKKNAEMWRREALTPGEYRKYMADLAEVESLLLENRVEGLAAPPAPTPIEAEKERKPAAQGPNNKGETKIVRQQAQTTVPNVPPRTEPAAKRKTEPAREHAAKSDTAASNRFQAIDQLLVELESEMKSSSTDWDKIQRLMGDLTSLKRTDELVDQLWSAAEMEGVMWEPIRLIMAQLWSLDRDSLIELLPALLKS